MRRPRLVRTLGLACLACLGASAADWPQFLGPRRDGTTPESVHTAWPADGPPVRWSRPVGRGFSGPVADGHHVFLHHRRDDEERLECLDADQQGRTVWVHASPASYDDDFGFDDGPRATPAVTRDHVFTLGAAGRLACLERASGRAVWQVDLARDLKADKGFFGFACSPLIHQDLVLVSIGGRPEAGIAAFETATGRIRWTTTDHEAGYASPVLARLGDQTQAVFFTRKGLVVLDPLTGRLQAEHPWRSRQHASVNASTPLVLGERVFLSASYGTGAVLLDLRTAKPTPVWSGDDQLSSHYASVVHQGGLLFGFHGRQEYGPSLRCLDAADGRVCWSEDNLGAGTLMLAGTHLLVLTERGELLVAPASRVGFQPIARAQILGTGVRAHAALAGGRLLARDPRTLVCLDLRPPAAP